MEHAAIRIPVDRAEGPEAQNPMSLLTYWTKVQLALLMGFCFMLTVLGRGGFHASL